MIEYFSSNIWLVWLLVSFVCMLLELTSGDLYILCFAVGALFSALASALGLNWIWQVLFLAFFALISIFFLRPLALRWLHRSDVERPSNADAIIGRVGVVSQQIEKGGYGRVALDGDDWKAVSKDGESIAQGRRVRITGRESIIITVEETDMINQ